METPYLTDFGLAKATATGSDFTRTGQALGTPAYMSPEQARGEADLAPGSDVWALGCVLYELLTGRLAFEGATPAAVVGKVLLAEPAGVRKLVPGVPRDVERIVRDALRKDRGVRYPDAGALRADLDRALRGQRPAWRAGPPRRWPLVLAAPALAGLAAALVAGAYRLAALEGPAAPDPAGPAALADRARAIRSSDPGRAAALLELALRADESRHEWRLELGLLWWATGKAGEARDAWGAIPADAPEAAHARLFLGLEALFRLEEGRRQTREAETHLQAIASSPSRAGRLARAALEAIGREWSQARARLATEDGWEVAALRGYVERKDPSGDADAAVRQLSAALDHGIAFPWAYKYRGVAKRDLGDTAGAVADLDRAIELDPAYASAWNSRGIAKRLRGDLTGAQQDYTRALELDPQSEETYVNRGNVRVTLRDLAGASSDFDRAIELKPTYGRALRGRAQIHMTRQDLTSALADYDRAVAAGDESAMLLYERGTARYLLGDAEGAIQDLDRAIAGDATTAEFWANRGFAKGALGDAAGARADLERSLALAPPGWANRQITEDALARARDRLRGE